MITSMCAKNEVYAVIVNFTREDIATQQHKFHFDQVFSISSELKAIQTTPAITRAVLVHDDRPKSYSG
jgi:hypothetical protein